MAKEEEKIKQQAAGAPNAPTDANLPSTPNRDAYKQMMAEDYPDLDFEDKEARYGRMVEDRQKYRDLSKAGRGLSAALDKHRWLGAMFNDLAQNPDLNPLTWMSQNGIDIRGALEDEKIAAEVDEAFKSWTQKQVDGETSKENALNAQLQSKEALDQLQDELGLSDEQAARMWEHFWQEIVADAFEGKVSKDTWTGILHAMNYDSDIKNAREEAGMQARNEKFNNNVKSFAEKKVPPTFSQGQGRVSERKTKKEGVFDDLKDYH